MLTAARATSLTRHEEQGTDLCTAGRWGEQVEIPRQHAAGALPRPSMVLATTAQPAVAPPRGGGGGDGGGGGKGRGGGAKACGQAVVDDDKDDHAQGENDHHHYDEHLKQLLWF